MMYFDSSVVPDTAHANFVAFHRLVVYVYDPADDGPEVEAIVSIRINHTEADLEDEFSESCWHSIDAAMDAVMDEELDAVADTAADHLFKLWEKRGTL